MISCRHFHVTIIIVTNADNCSKVLPCWAAACSHHFSSIVHLFHLITIGLYIVRRILAFTIRLALFKRIIDIVDTDQRTHKL